MVIEDLVIIFFKVCALVASVLVGRAVQLHLKNQSKIKRLSQQGIFSYPGNDTFLVGPALAIGPEYEEKQKEKVLPSVMVYAFNKLKLLSGKHSDSKPGDPEFDASKYPMIVYNLVAQVMTYVSDPDVVQDMYNKHSKHIDKHPMVIDIFEPIFGRDVFALMHTNILWKTNRKACAHMFYKERLQVMIGVFKLHLNKSCDKWLAEIASNGETRIDISCEFERIFAHTINHVCFGEDYNDDRFEIFFYEHSTKTFSKKLVSMR